jgi:hypothetical protein
MVRAVGCSYKVWIFLKLVWLFAVISVLTRTVNITGLPLIGKASACNLPSYHSNEKKSCERLLASGRSNKWIFPVLCSLIKDTAAVMTILVRRKTGNPLNIWREQVRVHYSCYVWNHCRWSGRYSQYSHLVEETQTTRHCHAAGRYSVLGQACKTIGLKYLFLLM